MAQEDGIDIVRAAFRYQNRFSGSTMVFKVDFPVTEDAGFACFMKDLALVVKSGVKVVVVPGCAESIDNVLHSQNIACEYVENERITTAQALPFVEMAAFHVATRFITGLSSSRVDALIGNFVRARARGVLNGVDMRHTGEVDKIFAGALARILDFGMVPILPCLGWSPAGKLYNVSSDEIALAVSKALGAVKLIIVSAGRFFPVFETGGQPATAADAAADAGAADTAAGGGAADTAADAGAADAAAGAGAADTAAGGEQAGGRNQAANGGGGAFELPAFVERDEDGRIIRLKPHEAETLLTLSHYQTFAGGGAADTDAGAAGCRNQTVSGGRRPKWPGQLDLALRAAESGVERIHIIDGCKEGALLREIFTNLGAGTMIYADEQDLIRPLRSSEVPDVLRLLEPFVRRDILVRRSADDIQEKKDDYVVLEVDGSIRACGALHDWGEGAAEIAALASGPAFAEMGLGGRIVDYLLARARKAGFKRVFVLTTRTQDWFESHGFAEIPIEKLPARKRALYNPERKSKVYALTL